MTAHASHFWSCRNQLSIAGKLWQKLPAPDREEQAEQSKHRDPADSDPPRAQPDSHDQRDRNRRRHRENAPGTFRERLHDDEREDGEQNHHDREHADDRERADRAADFFLHHLAERFPAPPHRREEHNHVVHAAA